MHGFILISACFSGPINIDIEFYWKVKRLIVKADYFHNEPLQFMRINFRCATVNTPFTVLK